MSNPKPRATLRAIAARCRTAGRRAPPFHDEIPCHRRDPDRTAGGLIGTEDGERGPLRNLLMRSEEQLGWLGVPVGNQTARIPVACVRRVSANRSAPCDSFPKDPKPPLPNLSTGSVAEPGRASLPPRSELQTTGYESVGQSHSRAR